VAGSEHTTPLRTTSPITQFTLLIRQSGMLYELHS
jgi:hypothetical protein